MRIFTTGVLMGAGAVTIACGLIVRKEIDDITPAIISGLCLMSLSLFILRIDGKAVLEENEDTMPEEYVPDKARTEMFYP